MDTPDATAPLDLTGSRNEYFAVLSDHVSPSGPITLTTLRANANMAHGNVLARDGATELPDDERFAVTFRFPQDVTLEEVRALYAFLRESLTDDLAAVNFRKWETHRMAHLGMPLEMLEDHNF